MTYEPTVLSTARRCAENAEALAAEAALLAQQGSVARATSLAILGQEESGKSFLLSGSILGMFPNDPQFLDKIRRQHFAKQLFHYLAEMAAAMSDEMDLDRWAGEKAKLAQQQLTDHPDRSETDIFNAVMDFDSLLSAASDYLDENADSIKESVDFTASKQKDRLKQAGLYVDYNQTGGVVSVPDSIPPEVAERELASLQRSCRMLREFTNNWSYSADDISIVQQAIRPAVHRVSGTGSNTRYSGSE